MDFSNDYTLESTPATTVAAGQPAGWIDPITGTLGKLTDIYLEVTDRRAANQSTMNTAAALQTAAGAQKTAADTAAAQAAGQLIPGVSNTTLIVAGVAVVGLVVLIGALRK